MLDALRRWIAGAGDGADLRAVAEWATLRGTSFKRSRDGDGFVVEGRLDGRSWRLEWGPPQRGYIAGNELRLRMELGLAQDANMLLMSRRLMEALEAQTFAQYTEHMQTQIDVSTPEEMRWLAMFPKLPFAARELKQRFAAVAQAPTAAAAWIDGPLSEHLAAASQAALAADPPFVLMTLRGRLYLRLQLAEPEVAVIEAMIGLFETAATQALHLGATDSREGGPSTASTAWQTQIQPEPRDS